MGVLIAAGLWWAYFEPSPRATERLRQTDPVRRARHARDAYSYLRLPLVAGIVFFALGVHGAVALPAAPPDPPLEGAALTGGLALFFLGEAAYRWRDHHKLMVDRLAAGLAAAAVIPVATRVPALATLGALLLICVLRTAWEVLSDRQQRSPRAMTTGR
jgi:low temperature requirement protein LtrA